MPVFVLVPGNSLLGEGPCWDDRNSCLTWVDIRGRSVHRWPWQGARPTSRTFAHEVSLALPCADDTLVVTQVDHVVVASEDGQTPLATIDAANPHTRLNDGCIDDDGNLWVGTYSTRGRPEAALFVVSPSGSVTAALTELVASNGVAWTADGTVLVHADTGRGVVRRYRRTRDGELAAIDTLEPLGDSGRPDGLAVDDEGGVWVAMFGGGLVARYGPDGRLVDRIPLPVTYPTSVTFVGPDRSTLAITTCRHRLPDPDLEPLAGSVLALDAGVRGQPTRRFGS